LQFASEIRKELKMHLRTQCTIERTMPPEKKRELERERIWAKQSPFFMEELKCMIDREI
jgi:hypothetical protein